MRTCRERGRQRQGYADQRGFVPYGDGTEDFHSSGYMGELAFSKYLGIEMPEDWTWEGDHRRGFDTGGWQVRSSWSPKTGMLIRPTDKPGHYVHIVTYLRPTFWIVGWCDLAWANEYGVDGETPGNNPKPCKYVPIGKLWPLPDIHGSFMLKEVEYDQAA